MDPHCASAVKSEEKAQFIAALQSSAATNMGTMLKEKEHGLPMLSV